MSTKALVLVRVLTAPVGIFPIVTWAPAGVCASVEAEKSEPKLAMLNARMPARLSGTWNQNNNIAYLGGGKGGGEGGGRCVPCKELCANPHKWQVLGLCQIDTCANHVE
jgi:hypothetical protein